MSDVAASPRLRASLASDTFGIGCHPLLFRISRQQLDALAPGFLPHSKGPKLGLEPYTACKNYPLCVRGCSTTILNPETLNPKPQNPKPLKPRNSLNPKPWWPLGWKPPEDSHERKHVCVLCIYTHICIYVYIIYTYIYIDIHNLCMYMCCIYVHESTHTNV